jgi:hypothetical protein
MGRGRWAVAAPAGLAANLLLIGLLSLVERAPPPVEPPAMLVELDRTEEEDPPPAPKRAARTSSAPSALSASVPRADPDGVASAATGEGEGGPSAGSPGPAAPPIDPAWRLDRKDIDRWKLTEGNPDFRWGRYHRACKGLSSEHLTDEEKDKCWGSLAAKAPSPRMGPVGRLAPPPAKFVPRGLPPPPPPFAEDARKQARCGAYRAGRAEPPRLRDGIC